MTRLPALLACLCLASPALAQSLGEKTGADAALGVTPSTADFVTEAADSDLFEIQSSMLAARNGDAPTKTFADRMVADHQKTTDQLKRLIGSGASKATLPRQLDPAHQKMLDTLNGLKGPDFIEKYASDQVAAHTDAVSLFRRYAKGGDAPELKDWAGKTLPELQHHLQMAQSLGKQASP